MAQSIMKVVVPMVRIVLIPISKHLAPGPQPFVSHQNTFVTNGHFWKWATKWVQIHGHRNQMHLPLNMSRCHSSSCTQI